MKTRQKRVLARYKDLCASSLFSSFVPVALVLLIPEIATCEMAGDKYENPPLFRKRLMGYTSARGGLNLKYKRKTMKVKITVEIENTDGSGANPRPDTNEELDWEYDD